MLQRLSQFRNDMGEPKFGNRGFKNWRALTLVFLLSALAGCSTDHDLPSVPNSQTRPPADSVDAALRQSRIEDALRLARAALVESPNDPERLTDAARATAASGERHEAAKLLAEAAIAADFKPTSRVELGMRALLDLGEVYPAIELLSQAVDADPQNHDLRRFLFGLLGEAGRIELMREHFEAIIRNRKFDVPVLLAYTDTSQRLFPAEAIESLIARNPSDHRLRLGAAQSLRDDRRFADAEAVLREIVLHHPDFAPAHALLGRMPGVQQATSEDYSLWLSAALPLCRDQADFWIARGDRRFQSADFTAALACYIAAARINPNLVIPWTQISRSIRQIRRGANQENVLSDEVAERWAETCDRRAKGLLDVRTHLQHFGGSLERSQRAACDVARTLSELSRYWEAEAWSAIAVNLPGEKDPGLSVLRQSIIAKLRANQSWSSPPDLRPLDVYASQSVTDLDGAGSFNQPQDRRPLAGNSNELRIADETESRNLVLPSVRYHNLASALIHTMGAGGGSLDFDLDGWCDLIFASGGELREVNAVPNTLLRNLDGRFGDISVHAHCGDKAFGQGIAIGDYNEDGFPDIFLANIGANQLLRNNGDGTFADDTRSLGTEADQWTTSGAFCDMDSDGMTDLIAVNYCDLNSPVDEPCQTEDGPAPCHPAKFPADRDQFLLGNGTGGFRESFVDGMGQISPGRGLGILAGNLSGRSPSAFVANDMSANHLLQVTSQGLAEFAVPSGIAVDGQSLAQASMGIAFGDFDGDLDLDMYVTGFAREYNIYYEQFAAGLWVDNTAVQGLVESTRMTVGFGTQAIDMDADGVDELAITNGHIGDFGPGQPPPAQPFQLMRRSEKSAFEEADVTHEASYLSTSHIGRALWKIDVDRDLADDLIVTHQNAPPTLLANRTETDNRRFGVQCIGTESSRDAIGAIVRFVAGGRRRAMWLLSGDGYMCSNERILKAGIGASGRVEGVTVTWPSGTVESFGTLDADQTYLLVEGAGEAFVGD